MKDNIVRYSKIKNGMTKKDKKLYEKNHTILLDRYSYNYLDDENNYTDIETLILSEKEIKDRVVMYINDVNAKNIYVENQQNLGDITLPYELLINTTKTIYFKWEKEYRKEKLKINIVLNDKTVPLEANLVKHIDISKIPNTKKLGIRIQNYNSTIKYNIDTNGIINKEYKSFTITRENVKTKILNLIEYTKYEEINFKPMKIDTLIINKDVLKNIRFYNSLFDRVKFNTLKIIDNNPMKLNPLITEIELNDGDNISWERNGNNGYFLYINGDNKKIIYLDSNDDFVVLDENKIKGKDNVDDVRFIIKNSVFYTYSKFIMIIKNKDNTLNITSFEKSYKVNNMFKKFLLLNFEDYFADENIKTYIKMDEWEEIFKSWNNVFSSFENIYKDFLVFESRIKELKNIGFTDKAIDYLIDREVIKIINTNLDNTIELTELDSIEVKLYNKIAENYVMKKLLKKQW